MKSAITVSLVPEAAGGPFVFWDGLADACEHAARFGFDAIEIFPPDAGALAVTELRALLEKHLLSVAALGTGAGWVVRKCTLTHADPAVRQAARNFIHEIIEKAAAFSAPAILGSMQGRYEGGVERAQALDWLADALQELGRHAAELGQVFLYEPLNRYETNLFNRATEAAAFLDERQIGPVRLLCDLFHMNIEETSISETLRAVGARLGHVHFVDSNRCAAGLGHLDFPPIVQALRDIGYTGFLSAEALPRPDAPTAARQTIESFRRLTAAP